MKDQEIRLKTVYELRVDEFGQPTRYFIPAYQRGFRWNATQVTQLLDDILEFTRRKNPQPEEFYCLQPLVLLAREDGAYEVVDGQQRLTTLLLILRHFNDRAAKKYQQTVYTLTFATRSDLDAFLEDPTDTKAATNIDYSHIARAMKVIEAWFAQRESEVEVIKDSFLALAGSFRQGWSGGSCDPQDQSRNSRRDGGHNPLTSQFFHEQVQNVRLHRLRKRRVASSQFTSEHRSLRLELGSKNSPDRSSHSDRLFVTFGRTDRDETGQQSTITPHIASCDPSSGNACTKLPSHRAVLTSLGLPWKCTIRMRRNVPLFAGSLGHGIGLSKTNSVRGSVADIRV